MYSPVFLSNPTTSGSPPVLSISWSDHIFSGLAFSFACTLAHSRPLWRFMFFSKRAFNVLSSSSRCSGDNFFFVSTPFIGFLFIAVSCEELNNSSTELNFGNLISSHRRVRELLHREVRRRHRRPG